MGRSYASDEEAEFGDAGGLRRSCWTPGERPQRRPCGVGLGQEARLGRRQQPATPCHGAWRRSGRRSRAPAPEHRAGSGWDAAAAPPARHIDLTHHGATRWGGERPGAPPRLPAGSAAPGVPDGRGRGPAPRSHALHGPARPQQPKAAGRPGPARRLLLVLLAQLWREQPAPPRRWAPWARGRAWRVGQTPPAAQPPLPTRFSRAAAILTARPPLSMSPAEEDVKLVQLVQVCLLPAAGSCPGWRARCPPVQAISADGTPLVNSTCNAGPPSLTRPSSSVNAADIWPAELEPHSQGAWCCCRGGRRWWC